MREAGGWWPFDRFMAAALYEPGLGYYARGGNPIGAMPASGTIHDLETRLNRAPNIAPIFPGVNAGLPP